MTGAKWRNLWLAGLCAVFVMAPFASVNASTASISRSYATDQKISDGSLVSLDPASSNKIVEANTKTAAQLVGIAVLPSTDSLIAVDAQNGGVQVATSGVANALVSTANGDIVSGDQIAVSPFDGIGMKAGPGLQIIGLAQTGFNAHSDGALPQTVRDNDGKTQTVSIGYVRVSIGIGTASSRGGTSAAQRFAKSLTGHTVSTTRLIMTAVVMIVAITALITLIYSSIYSSIISIGRNPLAKFAIFRTLGSVLGMAIMTASIAALAIFLLLR